MSTKRILIIHEDRLLSNIYRERLEMEGFGVETVRTGAAGLSAVAEGRPDVVVIDAFAPAPGAVEIIATLRGAEATRHLPILVLPTARLPVLDAAETAGASKILPRGVNPMAELIDALQTTLGLERTATHSKGLPFHVDDSWLKMSLGSAPEVLTAMRRALHGLSREPGDRATSRDLLQTIHGLTEQMAILGQRPLFEFASGMEALIYDLYRLPEQVNPSTLRTLGQALDFLAVLLGDQYRTRAKDPASAQILVVDDEDGARMIIMASMRLVALKSVAADTPAASLAILGVQGFDLIFLDVGLPEMNGFELCTKVRTLPLHEKTPIVFLTGMSTFQNRVQSSLSGGNDFVGKPFNVPELGLKALIWVFKGQLGLL